MTGFRYGDHCRLSLPRKLAFFRRAKDDRPRVRYNLPMSGQQIHFVTGRLAEYSLRAMLAALAPRAGFEFTVEVLPITVAALMTAEWIGRRWHVPEGTGRIILPGYCQGDLEPLRAAAGVPVELGPRDLRRLPEF